MRVSTMRRGVRGRLAAVATTGALFAVLLSATPVAAFTTYTKCEPGSGVYAGRCWTNTTGISSTSTIVEVVTLENGSSKTVTMHCSFTQTITKTFSANASISATAKASAFGIVDLSTTLTVAMTITQSASQATTAGGSVVLAPGESVICQRRYVSVTQTIRENWWTQSGAVSGSKSFTVTVPSSMGVRIIDG